MNGLVVMELGSRWPGWLPDRDSDAVTTIAQTASESVARLEARVLDALRGGDFQRATFVTNGRREAHWLPARKRCLRALLEGVGPDGEVVLVGDGRSPERKILADLTLEMNHTLSPAACLRYRVQLRHPLRESGPWSLPPIDARMSD